MSKIGIIGAMELEVETLKTQMSVTGQTTCAGMVFFEGTLGQAQVVVVRCGIGKVNAAIATLTLIDSFHPSLVINTGVAGGTGAAGILDVVIPDRIAYHDVWCGPDTVWGQAAGCPRFFECPLPASLVEKLGARQGLLASGDIFVSRREEVDHILSLYPDAVAVDMESAAIAQVCSLKNVPFVCIRVISDTPGAEDNIAQYSNFWEDAPESTFHTLTKLLKAL